VKWNAHEQKRNEEQERGQQPRGGLLVAGGGFAEFTGDEANLAEARRHFTDIFVAKQMTNDGSFPAELRRTKPYGYSNLSIR